MVAAHGQIRAVAIRILRGTIEKTVASRSWLIDVSGYLLSRAFTPERFNGELLDASWSKLKLYRSRDVYLLSVRTRRSPQMPRRVYAFILSFERAKEAAIWIR